MGASPLGTPASKSRSVSGDAQNPALPHKQTPASRARGPRAATKEDRAYRLLESLLTPREITVLEQIAQGKTNREIAESLYLAEKTVKNYVSTVILKMGMGNRAGAAAYFVRSRAASKHPPAE